MDVSIHSVADALMIAVSGVCSVFVMLACLAVIIAVINAAMGKSRSMMQGRQRGRSGMRSASGLASQGEQNFAQTGLAYQGEVRLFGLEEKTAACIMAVVSYETGIPLDQLVFKSIRSL